MWGATMKQLLMEKQVGATPSDWTKVLTRVAKDKKWREEMGRNLHETTEKFFDLNKVVNFRIEMYDDYFENQVN